jgi:hypothetical protein
MLEEILHNDDVTGFIAAIAQSEQEDSSPTAAEAFIYYLTSLKARENGSNGNVAVYICNMFKLDTAAKLQEFIQINMLEYVQSHDSFMALLPVMLELPDLMFMSALILQKRQQITLEIYNGLSAKHAPRIPSLIKNLHAIAYIFSNELIIKMLQCGDVNTAKILFNLDLITMANYQLIVNTLIQQNAHVMGGINHTTLVTLYSAAIDVKNHDVAHFPGAIGGISWDNLNYLHLASQLGYVGLVKQLVQANLVNVHKKNADNLCAAEIALKHDQRAVFEFFIHHEYEVTGSYKQCKKMACISGQIHYIESENSAKKRLNVLSETAANMLAVRSMPYLFGMLKNDSPADIKQNAACLDLQRQHFPYIFKQTLNFQFTKSLAVILQAAKVLHVQDKAIVRSIEALNHTLKRCVLRFEFDALEILLDFVDKVNMGISLTGINAENPLDLAIQKYLQPATCTLEQQQTMSKIIHLLIEYGFKLSHAVRDYATLDLYHKITDKITLMHCELETKKKLPKEIVRLISSFVDADYLHSETAFTSRMTISWDQITKKHRDAEAKRPQGDESLERPKKRLRY